MSSILEILHRNYVPHGNLPKDITKIDSICKIIEEIEDEITKKIKDEDIVRKLTEENTKFTSEFAKQEYFLGFSHGVLMMIEVMDNLKFTDESNNSDI